ncbi:unnamed protein product [Spirodela intermedia]|uniref:Uncharacterized protein n=1 Tax=Spirodela intermedia TaxID=51605 RepID=A0A7I8J6B4_SPIIN|nr:unnamed protein product [Spirodela intermedia]CAA6665285.1 unnamed protein product [Spirodela intermedia]
MSWMLARLLSLFMEFRRMKYFWAWLATCVGVLEMTKFLDMLLQSPLPNLSRPSKNSLRGEIHRHRQSEISPPPMHNYRTEQKYPPLSEFYRSLKVGAVYINLQPNLQKAREINAMSMSQNK